MWSEGITEVNGADVLLLVSEVELRRLLEFNGSDSDVVLLVAEVFVLLRPKIVAFTADSWKWICIIL